MSIQNNHIFTIAYSVGNPAKSSSFHTALDMLFGAEVYNSSKLGAKTSSKPDGFAFNEDTYCRPENFKFSAYTLAFLRSVALSKDTGCTSHGPFKSELHTTPVSIDDVFDILSFIGRSSGAEIDILYIHHRFDGVRRSIERECVSIVSAETIRREPTVIFPNRPTSPEPVTTE